MDMWDFAREIVDCEREYQTLNEILKELITFQQFVSYKNPSWSKDEVTHWVNIAEEKRAKKLDGGKNRVTPHPLGAGNFATVAKCLGNQIIDVGVKVRSTLLRCTMTVMMRCVRMQR
jgi:hypothetical protein